MESGTGMVPCRVVYGLAVHKGVQVEDSELYLEDVVVVVVVVHMGEEMARGELGRGMGMDRYDGNADGGLEGLEMGGYDGSVSRVEEGRERGRGLHRVTPTRGDGDGGYVDCNGGRRAPCKERGQGMELQPRHASRRRVGSLYGTLPRILCLSLSCTSSHIFLPTCWCTAALAHLVLLLGNAGPILFDIAARFQCVSWEFGWFCTLSQTFPRRHFSSVSQTHLFRNEVHRHQHSVVQI